MKCEHCNYETLNRKSFANHTRHVCPTKTRGLGLICKECGKGLLKKWKTGKQATTFCNRECYGKWSSKHRRGINATNYVHGKSRENLLLRSTREYKEWRKSVLKRDNYTCVICGCKSSLEADHIKDFALFPDLRLELSNGRTLCKPCHKKTDNYGFKKSNSRKGNQIQRLGH